MNCGEVGLVVIDHKEVNFIVISSYGSNYLVSSKVYIYIHKKISSFMEVNRNVSDLDILVYKKSQENDHCSKDYSQFEMGRK